MSLFSHKELLGLNDRLVELHASPDLGILAERALGLMRMVIDADYWGIGLCEPHFGHVVGVWEPKYVPLRDYAAVFDTIQHTHPLYTGWKHAGTKQRVLRNSDCIDSDAWRNNPVYCEVHRPLGLKHQVGVWSELGPGWHIEIGCQRVTSGSDFTKRDRDRIDFIRPHITQAYLNWHALAVARGLPPGPSLLLQQDRVVSCRAQRAESTIESSRRGTLFEPLTPKEREIAHWMGEGKTNPEIGEILGISRRTVQKHLEHVFQKLGVETRTAAAMIVKEMGLRFAPSTSSTTLHQQQSC